MKILFCSIDPCESKPQATTVQVGSWMLTGGLRGYRVAMTDLRDGSWVLPTMYTTCPSEASEHVYFLTDNGEGGGFRPHLLELEEV